MKRFSTAFVIVVSLAIARNVPGQSFYNLNFEFATITPDPSSGLYPYAVYASTAIRGWTPFGFLSPQDILYDDLTLGAPAVSLVGKADNNGPNCLDGSYSVVIYGGAGGLPPNASISQTAVVPANAQSIRFIAQGTLAPAGSYSGGPLLLSLGGQNIPFEALSTEQNYTTYGANIPGFAGQLEQLTFLAETGNNNFWEIDDIQFSPSVIPEPEYLSLLCISIWFLTRRMKR